MLHAAFCRRYKYTSLKATLWSLKASEARTARRLTRHEAVRCPWGPPLRPAGRARATWHLSSNTVKNSISTVFYSCKYLHPATAEPKAAPAAVSWRAGCGQPLDGEAVTLDWKDGFYQLILIRAMTTSLLWGKSYFNIKECLTPLARSRPTRCKLFTYKSHLPLPIQLRTHACIMYVQAFDTILSS